MAKVTKQGVIVKKIDQRTVKVRTVLMKSHPIYKKRFKVVKHYLCDDVTNTFVVGDVVMIEETIPMSRTKRFVVKSKIGQQNMLGGEALAGEELIVGEKKATEKVEA